MSYLVLARKYRPSTFAEVVGQEHVTRTLGNAFATGRVHHAFLFCGPRGCGKTTLARIVGKALNCEARRGAEPCGACSACVSIGNGSAVDYQEMDGASNRGIDAIRELTEAVRYQPAVLRKKVYVIDEVHMLTTEAFNALLKTLEEPPPHVTFVLATTEPHKLPNTILSRCQRYDFRLVPAPRLAQHLMNIFAKEQLAIEPGAVSLVVRESGGSVRDALSLCDQLISYVGDAALTERHVAEVLGVADRSLTRSLVRALSAGDAGAALAAVESALERGVDEAQLARAIVRYLRDLSVLQVAPGRPGLIDATDEEIAELASEAGALERARVSQMFDRMLRCCDELGKSLQPRLVLDCALIDVATVEPLVPLGDLIERLTELEGRLAGGRPRTGSSSGGTKPAPRPAAAAPAAPSSRGPATPTKMAAPVSTASATSPAPSATSASPFSSALAAATAPAPASATLPASSTTSGSQRPPVSPAVGSQRPSVSPAGDSQRPPSSPAGALSPPSATARGSGPMPRTDVPHAVEAPAPSERSAPVSMQPSGPIPKVDAVASGSGPHDGESGRMQVPATPEDALRGWQLVLNELEAQRKISLRAAFEHARVLRWTADQLELGFPVDAHSIGEMALDQVTELRAIVRAMGPALKNVAVAVRMLDASESKATAARSIIEDVRERTTAERSRREAEAREHPITKHVLQTFGAQIKEIKTDV